MESLDYKTPKQNILKRIVATVGRRIVRLGQALNYDFCPNFNQYVYWLKKPVGWVISAIGFSALVGFMIGPQGFVLMWALVAFLVVGSIWPWLSMHGLQCRLDFDVANSEEQNPTTARLTVANRWPIPVFGLSIEGQFLQDIFQEEDKVAVGLQRIPGLCEKEFSLQFEPARRGVMPIEPPVIATGFPFGIYRTERPISVNDQIVVWPRCEPLDSIRDLDGVHFNIDGGLSDRAGHDGDVIGTRPYRRGDMLRHVNWAKTARTGKLVVLERQTAAQKSIRIVLDLQPQQHRGLGSRSSYEWAIRIAASIALHLHRHHSHLVLTCLGTDAEFPFESSNARGLSPMMDFLSKLPTLEELNETELVDNDAARLSKVRASDEVYWIGMDAQRKVDLLKPGVRAHEILLRFESIEEQFLGSPANHDEQDRIVVGELHDTREQINPHWEGICADA